MVHALAAEAMTDEARAELAADLGHPLGRPRLPRVPDDLSGLDDDDGAVEVPDWIREAIP